MRVPRVWGFEALGLGMHRYKSCMTLRTLNYGNDGIFLMGNAGFISSTGGRRVDLSQWDPWKARIEARISKSSFSRFLFPRNTILFYLLRQLHYGRGPIVRTFVG